MMSGLISPRDTISRSSYCLIQPGGERAAAMYSLKIIARLNNIDLNRPELDLVRESGDHQLMDREVFYGWRETIDGGISLWGGPAGVGQRADPAGCSGGSGH